MAGMQWQLHHRIGSPFCIPFPMEPGYDRGYRESYSYDYREQGYGTDWT